MLSIVAKAAGVPFFVAAPTTSIDLAIALGSDIEIEERGGKELTHAAGGKSERVVVDGIEVWNPAFDVADAKDITGARLNRSHFARATNHSFVNQLLETMFQHR